MLRQERNPQGQIDKIEAKITTIIRDIVYEVADLFPDEGFVSSLEVAQECWPQHINLPITKDGAMKILDDPNATKLDRLGAELYAEIWKKNQIRKTYRLPRPERSLSIGISLDSLNEE